MRLTQLLTKLPALNCNLEWLISCNMRCLEENFFSLDKFFKHGERAGKLLAYMAHSKDRPPVVISLRNLSGEMVTEPVAVTAMFHRFFSSLYTTTTSTDLTPIDRFPRRAHLSTTDPSPDRDT
ncbi:hypothetical protein AB205_0221670 [Aquarana catesbeiana]|uniref:Uncharacterized protein n=1 Tax=Aquarana catesbeiana TaxID=8400 RepID=A0A2G9RIQ0_AQUCT|nr:hypothetical protein AB205_0221670 [Aquarana catesbeiana]